MESSDSAVVRSILDRVRSDGRDSRLEAAREIRRLTRTSSENRRVLSGAIEPLVSTLQCGDRECREAAILALLNLAVQDERNKIKIVDAGALDPLLSFLQSTDQTLQEYSAAVLLTLSASPINKPTIAASGAIPHLLNCLRNGTPQAKTDIITTLHNLSTLPSTLTSILSSHPIPPLVALLKTTKKSSKTAEKCTALLESFLRFDEGRNSVTAEEGGVLAIVEVLEEGSLLSKEHAVGALLTMCESDREKYREVILKEGAIPGLLELTVRGTPKARGKARELLRLLRNSPYPRPELEADALENVVSGIVSKIDGEDRMGKAKKILAEMVQVSMEQSLKHLQQRASW